MDKINSTFKKLVYFLLVTIVFTSCDKDKNKVQLPINPNEQELITTVKLILRDSLNPKMERIGIYTDLTGAGQVSIDTIYLSDHRKYFGEVLLLNELVSPVDTVSHHVIEEAGEHQFFYHVSVGLDLTVDTVGNDVDANGVPLGIRPKIRTNHASKGSLTVLLKHQGSDKPTSGMGDESIGETDVEVSFPIRIK